jgi:hypothetical protein
MHGAAWQPRGAGSPVRRHSIRASLPAFQSQGIDGFDLALVCVAMIGIYTHYTIQLSPTVPIPSVPAGIAGLILLWRRRNKIAPNALTSFILVVLLYLLSIFAASDIRILPRRTNGLIQLTYSLAVGYGLFLTASHASRKQMERLFLALALVILVGCLLEQYAGLRRVSDAVRNVLYSQGLYENDLRDLQLYKRVRPKFFASEPSSVSFCFTLFSFLWMVISPWRWKLVVYAALMGLGLFAIPGPTVLLMLVLLLPYILFLESRRAGRLDYGRFLVVLCVAAVLFGVFIALGLSLFSTRLEAIRSGDDPSFFYRVQGPTLAGLEILRHYPIAGGGLAAEPFVEWEITNVYLRSPSYSVGWKVVYPATELVINYFWEHWIYLGLVWGVAVLGALSIWLRLLGVPSVAFCWTVWAILGQASGAYVGPQCWAVLFLAAGAAVLHQRGEMVPYRQTLGDFMRSRRGLATNCIKTSKNLHATLPANQALPQLLPLAAGGAAREPE